MAVLEVAKVALEAVSEVAKETGEKVVETAKEIAEVGESIFKDFFKYLIDEKKVNTFNYFTSHV